MALNRVEALVMAGNVGSMTLLSRLGFSHEGKMRSRALHRGEFRDVWTFGLLQSEWAGRN
jgi:RimJ/RimL family protein N-acetyltransferase